MTVVRARDSMDRVTHVFSGLVDDLRDALRSLRRSGAFTAWVVGSLAIGMAVTIAALALLNGALFLPFQGVADQDRLVRVAVSGTAAVPTAGGACSRRPTTRRCKRGCTASRVWRRIASATSPRVCRTRGSCAPIAASPNYFDVLGVRPALGRTFGAGDAAANAPVAVVAHSTWTRELGADPNVIGRSIRDRRRLRADRRNRSAIFRRRRSHAAGNAPLHDGRAWSRHLAAALARGSDAAGRDAPQPFAGTRRLFRRPAGHRRRPAAGAGRGARCWRNAWRRRARRRLLRREPMFGASGA